MHFETRAGVVLPMEPQRGARCSRPRFCRLCIDPNESEDVGIPRYVISSIPQFMDCPNVLGIVEIG